MRWKRIKQGQRLHTSNAELPASRNEAGGGRLAHLQTLLNQPGALVRLLGREGSGKSHLARELLRQAADRHPTALIVHSTLSRHAFLTTLFLQWEIAEPQERLIENPLAALRTAIRTWGREGRYGLLILDNAQAMGLGVCEALVDLRSGTTREVDPLRILLLGRPELQALMDSPPYQSLKHALSGELSLESNNGQPKGLPRRRSTIPLQSAPRAVVALFLLGTMATFSLPWVPPGHEVEQAPRQANPLLPVHVEELQPPPDLMTTDPAKWVDLEFEEHLASGQGGQERAFERLLQLWEVDGKVATADALCLDVKRHGLRCLKGSADWDFLSRVGRPALLVLWPGLQGLGAYFVVYHGMRAGAPVIDFGAGPIRVARETLDDYWTGDYLLLWRSHCPAETIGPGSSGPGVAWVRSRLRDWDGVIDRGDRFDPPLGRRLKGFQLANHLEPDGVAGEKTLVLLDRLSPDWSGPRLREDRALLTQSTPF